MLDVLEAGVLDNARCVGAWLADQIGRLGHPDIQGIRGEGLLRGLVVARDIAPQLVEMALEDGWVLNAPRPGVVRLAPPLIIAKEQLAPFVAALPEWLERSGG